MAIVHAATLSLHDHALLYARCGFAVFPCLPGMKSPATRNGFHDATLDLDAIEKCWTDHPDANIGCPTGPGSFDVLDVDRKMGGHGFVSYFALMDAGLLRGSYAMARTRNGGLHLMYPPSGSGGSIFKFIDIKAAGGYVLLPPSRVAADPGIDADGTYTWLDFGKESDGRPLNMDAIKTFLRPVQAFRPSPSPRRSNGRSDDASGLLSWLGDQPEGNRNQGLFWAASRAHESGLLDSRTLSDFRSVASAIGLTQHEANATLASARGSK